MTDQELLIDRYITGLETNLIATCDNQIRLLCHNLAKYAFAKAKYDEHLLIRDLKESLECANRKIRMLRLEPNRLHDKVRERDIEIRSLKRKVRILEKEKLAIERTLYDLRNDNATENLSSCSNQKGVATIST